jgi:hypothetical protein
MAKLEVERLGGFAGVGRPGSRLRSSGSVDSSDLSEPDRKALEDLFAQPAAAPQITPDAYVYRLTRQTEAGPQSIEVAEHQVPDAVKAIVKDQIV